MNCRSDIMRGTAGVQSWFSRRRQRDRKEQIAAGISPPLAGRAAPSPSRGAAANGTPVGKVLPGSTDGGSLHGLLAGHWGGEISSESGGQQVMAVVGAMTAAQNHRPIQACQPQSTIKDLAVRSR